jgi:hypothetical protein
MSQWCRLWEDMPNDPKWRVVARRAGRPVSEVMAVFVHMMVNACSSDARGTLASWSDEDVAIAIDADVEHVAAIRQAMQGKTLDDDHLTGWEKRQPLREDGAAERAKAWREKRERERDEAKRTQTHANACEPPDEIRVDTDTEQKEAELNVRDRRSLDNLEARLREAADLIGDPSPSLFDLSPIMGLIDAGYDVEAEILPSVRSKRRKGIRSWKYFVQSIHDARATRTASATGIGNARAGPNGTDRPTKGVASALAGIDAWMRSTPD